MIRVWKLVIEYEGKLGKKAKGKRGKKERGRGRGEIWRMIKIEMHTITKSLSSRKLNGRGPPKTCCVLSANFGGFASK